MANTQPALPRFIAAGEALTDLITDKPADGQGDRWISKVGGATWNVARVVSRLGVPAAFAGAISRDLFGNAIWNASGEAGLDPRFLQRLDRAPLLAVVHSTHPPRYFFVGDDSADLHFNPATLPAGWRDCVEWAHFGGISLAREPLAAMLVALAGELKARGVRISFDPNFRNIMDERFDATLRRMVALADVVKVSDEDLAGLYRTADIAGAFECLRAINPAATILYTRGEAGASLHIGGRRIDAPAPRINVVDTVGAGDASIGGLVASLMQHPEYSSQQHLRFAVAAGAAACLHAGAAPPTLAEIQSLLAP